MNYANLNDVLNYIKLELPEEDTKLSYDEISQLVESYKLANPPTDKRSIYTSKDIKDIRNYLVNLVEQSTSEWTDFNESDAGMVLIELMSGLADMLGFYLDKQSLECYIGTVKQRKNAANILKLINYKMHLTNSSVTTLKFSLSEPSEYDVVIPKYTQVAAVYDSSIPPVFYATSEDTIIVKGALSTEVKGIQGEVNRAYITVSDLKKNKKITLLTNSLAHGTMSIIDPTSVNKELWSETTDALLKDGPFYSIEEDKDLNAVIRFSNNYVDFLPKDESVKLEIIYLNSLADKGNVRKGLINSIVSELSYSDNGEDIKKVDKITVTNTENSSGGSQRESIKEARVNAPNQLAMLGKAITLRDYHDMTLALPSVLKCTAVDWTVRKGAYVSTPYLVKLYVVPKSGDTDNNALLKEIRDYFTKQSNRRCPSSMQVEVYPPEYINVDIDVNVYTDAVTNNHQRITSAVTSVLKNFFSYKNLSFGQSVSPSNLITMIEESSPLIDSIKLIAPTLTPKVNDIQMLNLGNLNLNILDVNAKYE